MADNTDQSALGPEQTLRKDSTPAGDKTSPAPAIAASRPTVPPATGLRYDVVEELGHGGIGRVLLADDQRLLRQVALKELLAGVGADEERFLREARLTAGLEHPGIVPIYDLDHHSDGAPFYTMRRIRGRSLGAALKGAATLDARLRMVRHFREACEAVAYAHAHGVIHRDLKPDNVMVGEFGETIVLDWGLAKLKGGRDEAVEDLKQRVVALAQTSSETLAGSAVGTPAYMSPEQAKGELAAIDERSDVWGLGAILFEILAGQPPFPGGNALAVLEKVRTDEPREVHALCPDAPPELVAVVRRALRRDPAARYATAKELADDISAWLDGRPLRAYRYSAWQQLRLFVRRHKAGVGAALAILVAAAAASAFSAWSWRKEAAANREAHRMLARALQEKAERALAEKEHGAAAIFAAAALREDEQFPFGSEESAEAEERTVLLRSTWIEADEGREVTWLRDIAVGASPSIRSMRFSPDGRRLALLTEEGRVMLLDDLRGAPRMREVDAVCPKGSPNHRYGLSWSPDGRRIAVASGGDLDCSRNLAMLDADVLRLVEHTPIAAAQAVAFSPDGKVLASGTADSRAVIARLEDGATPVSIDAGSSVMALAWSNDGRLFFCTSGCSVQAVSADGSMAWQAEVSAAPGSLLFLPATNELLAVTADGRWWRFGATDGTLRQVLELPEIAKTVEGSSDLRVLSVLGTLGNTAIRSANGELRDVVRLGGSRPRAQALAPDGTLLAIPGRDAIRLFTIASMPRPENFAKHEGFVQAVATEGEDVITASFDRTLRRWQIAPGTESGPRIAVLPRASALPMAVAVSPDGARLALMTLKGAVEVWDAAGGGRIRSLREDGHVSQIVAAIAFSVDGGLATGFGKSIARWTAGDFRPLPDVATHATVHSIAYSGDGRWLACSEGNEVWLRRADGEEPRRLLQIERGMASSLAFSPDHLEILACGDDSLCRFLDVGTGKVRMVLRGHHRWVNRGIYSPDGKLVLTGSDDQTARLWDPETGRQLRVMKSSEEIVALGFSPDGKWLFFNDHSGLRRLPAVPGPSDSPAVLLERAERSAGLRLKGLDLVAFE